MVTRLEVLEVLAVALLQAAAAAAAWRLWASRLASAQQLRKREQMRVEERQGRIAAEKELRRVMDVKLDTSKGFFVQPVGEVRSCFTTCLGTPRQGLLAPSTRARIEFQRNISPDTLVGLGEFSHVWIVFVFHQNTNSKNSRAHAGLRSDSHRHTFRAKIAPPMLKERVGIFSTRSPHRPNPIGITLAKIEDVDMKARSVRISGVDLVDGTPVLDIKPYVPGYDCLPDARAAVWVSPPDQTVPEVSWRDSALISTLRELAASSSHYIDIPDTFVLAVEEVLRVDVRSKDQTKRWASADASHVVIDNARIEYTVEFPASGFETGTDTVASDSHQQPPTRTRITILSVEEARAFDLGELRMLMNGKPTIDVEELRASTVFQGGYNEHSQVVLWLWQALREFPQDARGVFLKFMTGTNKIPLDGFEPPLNLTKSDLDPRALPRTHTCFNQLVLPEYESYAVLVEKLTFAIQNAKGFELS